MRILVVDDNPDDISILTRGIKKTMAALANENVVSPHYLLRAEVNAQVVPSLVFTPGSSSVSLDSKLDLSIVDSIEPNDLSNSSSLSCGTCYDLIFVDTDMPGVKGYDLCRLLLNECDSRRIEKIYILGMSGRNEGSVSSEWQQAGAKGFFEKSMLFGLSSSRASPLLYHLPGKTILEGVIRNYVAAVEKDEYRACSRTSSAMACGAPCRPTCLQSLVLTQ